MDIGKRSDDESFSLEFSIMLLFFKNEIKIKECKHPSRVVKEHECFDFELQPSSQTMSSTDTINRVLNEMKT